MSSAIDEVVPVPPQPCPQCGQTMDAHAATCNFEEQRSKVFTRTWFVCAPWAHPFWSYYVISLADLTTPIDNFEPEKVSPDMTHEILVYALLPEYDHRYTVGMVKDDYDFSQFEQHPFLAPANHAVQFAARDDEHAQRVGQFLYKKIRSRVLNPDSDAVAMWQTLTVLGCKLHNSGHKVGIKYAD